MGKVHEQIDDAVRTWIERQHVFFVATAATSEEATVNVSPKGMSGSFVVLDERRCAYLDLTGSGIETVAHVRQNGRITLMWCAFEGPPRIVRVHGRGEVVTPEDPRWDELSGRFEPYHGRRAVVIVTADRISDSCGYSVPLMSYTADRDRLTTWADSRTDEELTAYRTSKNTRSIDGLPGL